ncbi:MAG: SUMF1/EgtB/PvdO family nonheme iron enzyme, partial [Planctomycetota bacterium]
MKLSLPLKFFGFCLVICLAELTSAFDTKPASVTNSIGMELVCIESGTFIMGENQGGDYDEKPVHKVRISKPFYMAAKEVTNAEYEMFDKEHRRFRGIRGVSKQDDEAVVYVSWHDAVKFCNWLSEKEGRTYRLPTEGEWEYACRAGTTTKFSTGDELPSEYHKNQPKNHKELKKVKAKVPISLKGGLTPANPWGLYDMHGNVEEWCHDWYGHYLAGLQADPVGREDGLFKVSRGGSHNSFVRYLRSANRLGTHPDDKHWLIGFRVVMGDLPKTKPLAAENSTLDDLTVDSGKTDWKKSEAIDKPFFIEPIPFVKPIKNIEALSKLKHHHCPSITFCDNGDLLAVWFSTISEVGRKMVILSSRLRKSETQWDTAKLFYKAPDRNMTGSNVFNDGKGKLYFFNGISDSSHHKDQCMVMSTSTDSGRIWSKPRIISSLENRHKYTPMDSAFIAIDGSLVLSVDYAPLGYSANEAGSGVFISRDRGRTWINKISGKNAPVIGHGKTDGLAAGFHISTVQLRDGSLMALNRKGDIKGHVTKSISKNMGDTWTYYETEFPGIAGGQRS